MPTRREDPDPLRSKRSSHVEGAQFIGVGLQFAGSILLFLFAGRWLDERLGTGPWLLLLGVFVGGAAGFYSLYRQLTSATRGRDDRRR